MDTRVFVVEEQPLLTLEIAEQLTDARPEVVDPAVSVAKAHSGGLR
jgi:hypothetical protein